jgi:hypothetical protein
VLVVATSLDAVQKILAPTVAYKETFVPEATTYLIMASGPTRLAEVPATSSRVMRETLSGDAAKTTLAMPQYLQRVRKAILCLLSWSDRSSSTHTHQ